MSDERKVLTLVACGWMCLMVATLASADFIGVVAVTKDDPDTDFQCAQGNGASVPGPLTVCNVYAMFDDPGDRLLSVGNAELQVFNGANPAVFFQHPFNFPTHSAPGTAIPAFPALICATFHSIRYIC